MLMLLLGRGEVRAVALASGEAERQCLNLEGVGVVLMLLHQSMRRNAKPLKFGRGGGWVEVD